MDALGRGALLACGDCAPAHPLPEGHPLTAILLIAALGALGAGLLLWQRRRRRRRRPSPVRDQWSALAVMGELCPHGWQAEITVYGSGAPLPPDAPRPSAPLVAVDWELYEDDSDRVAVARRVWARTVEEALQGMVDDRRLDVALEQIEHSAGGEDRG